MKDYFKKTSKFYKGLDKLKLMIIFIIDKGN